MAARPRRLQSAARELAGRTPPLLKRCPPFGAGSGAEQGIAQLHAKRATLRNNADPSASIGDGKLQAGLAARSYKEHLPQSETSALTLPPFAGAISNLAVARQGRAKISCCLLEDFLQF